MIRPLVGRTLVSGVVLLGTPAAFAQSPSDSQTLSAVLACADVDREILRLECYDEAVAALRASAESARAQSSAGRAAPRTAASDTAASRAANDAPGGAGNRPAAPADERPGTGIAGDAIAGDGTRAARGADSRELSPDATIDVEGGARSRSTPASARGDRAEEDEDRDRQVTVVDVRTNIPGRAVFVTSDGEEFVQTSGRLRLYLPDVPFVASVRSGAVGGMFLTPEGTRRSIRISARD